MCCTGLIYLQNRGIITPLIFLLLDCEKKTLFPLFNCSKDASPRPLKTQIYVLWFTSLEENNIASVVVFLQGSLCISSYSAGCSVGHKHFPLNVSRSVTWVKLKTPNTRKINGSQGSFLSGASQWLQG